jgi:hypothetical protein
VSSQVPTYIQRSAKFTEGPAYEGVDTHCSVCDDAEEGFTTKNMAKKEVLQKPQCIIEHIIQLHSLSESNHEHLSCLWGS